MIRTGGYDPVESPETTMAPLVLTPDAPDEVLKLILTAAT